MISYRLGNCCQRFLNSVELKHNIKSLMRISHKCFSTSTSLLIAQSRLATWTCSLMPGNNHQLTFCSSSCCLHHNNRKLQPNIANDNLFARRIFTQREIVCNLPQNNDKQEVFIKRNSNFTRLFNHRELFKNLLKIHTRNFETSSAFIDNIKTDNMSASQIISGKEVADEIRAKLRVKVEQLNIKPKLVIVQVGGREDSNVYIRMKIQFAESIGATAELIKLGRDVSENEIATKILELNNDKTVHGIITQLPFDCTQEIDSDKVVNLIDPQKDVDGLSIYNAGKLFHGELNSSSFVPCTPNGCIELIKKAGVQIEATHSVVIGRSKIVGSPMAQLLLWHDSTVTICHSKTKNIEAICRQADILVVAVGRAQMVKKSWLKPGAIVIDCGINVIPDSTKKSGTRLVGDVDFEDCKQVAGAITPVPGGVGPMTVAMLIANTVESACRVAASPNASN